MHTVLLETPKGIVARLGWDPAVTVHDRRRIIAREIVAEHLGCDMSEVRIEREAPKQFGYHTQLIASRGGVDLPLSIKTASFRAATVVAVCDPAMPLGIDIRDLHPEDADVHHMQKHSHLIDESNIPELLQHWVRVQAVLEADARGMRVSPEHVRLDAARSTGWIRDRKMHYTLTDLSRDGWVITMAYGAMPG